MVNGTPPIVSEAPSGSPLNVPVIGAVLLRIVKDSPATGVKPSVALSVLPPRLIEPVALSWE